MPSPAILEHCQSIIGEHITTITPVNGGNINEAHHLHTKNGSFFLKTNDSAIAATMFEAEASGLALLGGAGPFKIPKVYGFGSTSDGGFLLLEFIEQITRPEGFWEAFGSSLAELHQKTDPSFGLGTDNFIGSLPQQNCQHGNWPDFYSKERLQPQLDIAKRKKILQTPDYQSFERLFKLLPYCCPAEPPALVHGDLWSGNYLCSGRGLPVLIDPAASFSHREMDLAMTRLFGGFDRKFYQAYEAAWPLSPGFEQRLGIYQLYYLLVHLNLFGGGYLRMVREALASFD
ncbi:MAG: fructosamine kinase family protein [Saprospiraceae bacterium]|nr:fructosamine kinase family protein [Saprospiraceae bacterium]